MADKYVKTSKEELTLIAEGLRESGNFPAGQKFVFPSSEWDPNPVYTFKIKGSLDMEVITEAQAEQLVDESDYTLTEVTEFPDFSSAEANIVYYTVERQIGFVEGLEEVINEFYNKLFHGTLTQDDINGLVLDDNNKRFFAYPVAAAIGTFPNITEITVTADWLGNETSGTNVGRLSNLTTVHIQDPENMGGIFKFRFVGRTTLETIDCSPTFLGTTCFNKCTSLIVGPSSLKLDRCLQYGNSCLAEANLPSSITIAEGCNLIDHYAFMSTNLEKIYLPATPPELASTNSFDNNVVFSVATNDIKTTYSTETNWSTLISKFVVEARE